MPRPSLLCLVACFASLALAQNARPNSPAGQASSTPVQVVYVIDGTSLLTYNVDPQTLYATQVGSPIILGGLMGYGVLYPSPNNHAVLFRPTPKASITCGCTSPTRLACRRLLRRK